MQSPMHLPDPILSRFALPSCPLMPQLMARFVYATCTLSLAPDYSFDLRRQDTTRSDPPSSYLR